MAMSYQSVSLVTPAAPSWSLQGAAYKGERWLVRFTGTYDGAHLLNTPPMGVPVRRSSPAWDLGVIVDSIRCGLEGDQATTVPAGLMGTAFYEVDYSPLTYTKVLKSISPLNRPAVIEGGGSDLTEVRNFDADGKPMVNSAKEMYSNLPEQPVMGLDVLVRWNVSTNPASLAATISNTTNNAIWNGVAKGNGLIHKIGYRKIVEVYDDTSVTYWEVAAPISFKRDGWRWKPLDVGRCLTVGGRRVPWIEKDNQQIAEPQPLNGSGLPLEDWSAPVFYPADGYARVTEANWTTAGIPNPF